MSALTKTLIVLLTVASIFLCGIVVIYVSNAANYRQKYEDLRSDKDAIQQKEKNLTKQLNEKIKETDQQQQKLNSEIASLKIETRRLQTQLKDTEREKAALLQKVNNFAALVEDFTKTNDQQGLLLQNTLDELDQVKAEQIKARKNINDLSANLLEKLAIIDALDAEKKQLLEQKAGLQKKLDQLYRPLGREAVAPKPVTARKEFVAPAKDIKEIDLKAVVTVVDPKNSMAGISISAADGVKEGMIFHITRGDEFVRDILIIDVEGDEAVGIFDIGTKMPKIGDIAATNF